MIIWFIALPNDKSPQELVEYWLTHLEQIYKKLIGITEIYENKQTKEYISELEVTLGVS